MIALANSPKTGDARPDENWYDRWLNWTIDGDNKDLSIEYQKKRYESLSQKYPVLRIYNKEVDEKLVKNVIKNFIFKNVLLAIR